MRKLLVRTGAAAVGVILFPGQSVELWECIACLRDVASVVDP